MQCTNTLGQCSWWIKDYQCVANCNSLHYRLPLCTT